MEPIRLATPEEIESIKETSDLGPGCSVWAMGRVLGVVRTALELDPVYYADSDDRKKLMFVWGMENIMRSQGAQKYYFNVPANEEFSKYREIAKKLGAQEVSKEAEIRFVKSL